MHFLSPCHTPTLWLCWPDNVPYKVLQTHKCKQTHTHTENPNAQLTHSWHLHPCHFHSKWDETREFSLQSGWSEARLELEAPSYRSRLPPLCQVTLRAGHKQILTFKQKKRASSLSLAVVGDEEDAAANHWAGLNDVNNHISWIWEINEPNMIFGGSIMFWSYASVSGVKYKEMKVGLILLHNMMSWTQGRKKKEKIQPRSHEAKHCWSASGDRVKADCHMALTLWSQRQLLIILLELHLQNLCRFDLLYVDAVDQKLPFSHLSSSWTKQLVDLSF